MANYQPNEDYTGETKLRNWWPIVKANFADVYSKLNGHFNGTSDRHKGTDVDYSTQMTVTAAIDKEISDRTAADTAEQKARIAADNAEQEARMGADNAEQTARQEADTEIKNEMNNVFTESGIVEETTETSTLYIPGGAELGFTILNADGEPAKDFVEAKEIYPRNPNESAQAAIKINGTPITIGDYDTGAYDDLDYWEMPYGYVLLCYSGTITNENVYTLTKVAAEIAGGTRKSIIDREKGTFELVLAYAQDTIWSEEAQSNIFTKEIYERNTDNEVDSVRTVIHGIADKETVDTLQNSVEQNTTDIENISNNTTLIKNINGGFAAGDNAWTAYGGAIGRGTHTSHGGAIGDTAYSALGGAIGESSKAGNGFSGGKEAIVAGDSESGYIDAIQLGTGTNNNANTLQVYSYQLMDANGQIPTERMQSVSANANKVNGIISNTTKIAGENGGFAAGEDAYVSYGGAAVGQGTSTVDGVSVGLYASSADGCAAGCNSSTQNGGASGKDASSNGGGAAGNGASTKDGGAVGDSAISGDGFSGGKGAAAAENPDGGYIDTIQLGTGTNSVPHTLQVYSYQLLDANGKIPSERLPTISSKKYATVVVGASSAGYTASQVDYLCTGTNDQTVINQAIQALPSNGGKIVLLDGTYNISGQILINKADVKIEGMGPDITCIYAELGTGVFGAIYITNRSVYIKGISLTNQEQGNSGVGIYMYGTSVSDCKVEDCYISDFGYGVNISNAGKYHRIVDVKAENNTVGIHINNAYCEVVNNRCINSSETGINIEGSNNLITGNMVIQESGYSSNAHSIRLSMSPSNNFITGNYIPGKDVTQAGSNNTVTNNKYE